MAEITQARLTGRRYLGRDRYEYEVTFLDASGAEVSLGVGGSDIVIGSTDDLGEGTTHLYFTNARADARVHALIGDTDDVPEGSANLYFTPSRADARVNAIIGSTDDVDEGAANFYFTNARTDARVQALIASTDDVDEGTVNLYFTNTRADARANARIAASLASDATALAMTDATVAVTPHNLGAVRGVANGVAGLDGGGKVPSTQLPAYVDDVLEYSNTGAFPGTGVTGVIYVALDTNKTYRWSGSAYVEISRISWLV